MNQRQRRLPFETRPGFLGKYPLDLAFRRQRMKQGLDKAQSRHAIVPHELKGGYVDGVSTDLTVANHPVTAKLETGDAKFGKVHVLIDYGCNVIYQRVLVIDQ